MWFHKRERICRIIKGFSVRDTGAASCSFAMGSLSSTRPSLPYRPTFKVFLLSIGELSVPIALCADETLAVQMTQFALRVKSCGWNANQLPYVPSGAGFGPDPGVELNLYGVQSVTLRSAPPRS